MSSMLPPGDQPVAPSAAATGLLSMPGAPWANGQHSGPRSIMVIDDSLAVRKVIEASFARIGLPVSAYPDGIAAIQALSRGEVEVPDLVLLDIELPKMDGYQVAGILRNNDAFRNTIVIMLTSHDGMVDRVRSRMVGARDFISKPFRVSHVISTVRTHLRLPSPDGPSR
jgi:twitching motility two-component system response regulator PilG